MKISRIFDWIAGSLYRRGNAAEDEKLRRRDEEEETAEENERAGDLCWSSDAIGNAE